MKILSLHCDYIKFKAVKKAIKEPEEIEPKLIEVRECLVIFTAVESSDKQGIEEKLVENIKDIANQVKAKNIVIYPYAHLSSNLSKPAFAEQVLKNTEKILAKDKNFKVFRAPFGWYKEFELKCKGHPLSELSREILSEGIIKKTSTTEKEEKIDYSKLLREISKTKLDREKLKENDHRIIGQKLDLFSFSEVAPGMVFWHNKGLIIYNELINYWRDEHEKAGYEEISTPQVLDKKLWLISGHWDKYKNAMFLTEYENKQLALKPMNCPGGILVYKNKPRSYKELPIRMAELGIVHRLELSGVLAGLFRVVKFIQDDAHIYCSEEQLESEIIKIMQLDDKFYKKFGFEYHVELSTRPEKRIGTDKQWDKAEKILENVLKKMKIKFKVNAGDGAFYGPKIDFHLKDSQGRTWQCGTIQLDFAMPERFELKYTGEDNKEYTPVMLHRTVFGSLERFIGILLEHLNGNLPLWLAPVQVRVLSFTDRNVKTAEKIFKELKEAGIRVDSDFKNTTVDYKVREAEMQKIPYIIVIGDKEEEKKTIAVREGRKVKFGIKLDSFIKVIKEKIEKRD